MKGSLRSVLTAAIIVAPAAAYARGGGGGHGFSGGHSLSSSRSVHHPGYYSHGIYYHGYTTSTAGTSWQGYVTDIFIILLFIAAQYICRFIWSYFLKQMKMIQNKKPIEAIIRQAEQHGIQPPDDVLASARARPQEYCDIDVSDTKAFLRALKRLDDHFDAEIFLERAEMTYVALARARQHQELGEIGMLVAPELAVTLQTEIRTLADQRQTLRFDNLNIRRSGIEAIHLMPTRDEIVVHFDIVCATKTLNSDTGKRIKGSDSDHGYGERWKFIRKKGAQTVLTGGVLAKLCARCGATLDATNYGVCAHCDAKVSRGEIDWTVESIEASYYENEDRFRPVVEMTNFQDGVFALRQNDPGFLPGDFLARAETMFFSLQAAWQAGDLEKGCAYMSQTLYVIWSMQLESLRANNRRNIMENLRIVNMTPLHVENGVVYDRITLGISANCADYEVDATTNERVFGSKSERTFHERWTFQRKAGVASIERGIAQNVCPHCGAELAVNNIGVCKYCDVVITNGDFDWVLSRITQEDETTVADKFLSFFTDYDDVERIKALSREQFMQEDRML